MKHLLLRSGFGFLFFFLLATTAFSQITYYVSTAGADLNAGTSAALPFRNLNKALSEAKASIDAEVTIKVAAGHYYPTEAVGLPGLISQSGRVASFQIFRGDGVGKALTVEGGYNSDFSERDMVANETVLNGDIGTPGTVADNTFHIVLILEQAAGAADLVIDGFTVKNAFTDTGTQDFVLNTPIYHSQGGGFYLAANKSDKIRISNTKIIDNEVGGKGAGLLLTSGYYFDASFGGHPVYIYKCTFSNNKAGDGGAFTTNEYGDVLFEACSFTDNEATNAGGVMYAGGYQNIKFEGCIISDNKASTYGGVYYSSLTAGYKIELDGCTVSGNSASATGNGGAIFHQNGSLDVRNTTFTENTGSNGGAIYQGTGNLSITSTTFESNSSGNMGGAIYQGEGNLTISSSKFLSNKSATVAAFAYAGAGAIAFVSGNTNFGAKSVVNISNTLFENNDVTSAGTGAGGALYFFKYDYGFSPDIDFDVTIDKCQFTGNKAHRAGAMLLGSGGTFTISNTVFKGNKATQASNGNGGAVFALQSKVYFINDLFLDNEAEETGGAVAFNPASGSDSYMTNCTFHGNKGKTGGKVLYNFGSMVIPVKNSIFWNNQMPQFGANITMNRSLVQGGFPGGINILDTDPLFKNTADADGADDIWGTADDGFALDACSPAVDFGDVTGAPLTDIVGNNRYNGNNLDGAEPDLGIYESMSVNTLLLSYNGDTKGAIIPDHVEYQLNGPDCRVIATVNGESLTNGTTPFTISVTVDDEVELHNSQPLLQRHFELTPGGTNPTSADITLYVSKAEMIAFNAASTIKLPVDATDDKSTLLIWQWHGTTVTGSPDAVINPVDADIQFDGALQAWKIKFHVSSFSSFYITAENAESLPVTLVRFSGKKQEKSVQLTWQTSDEINSDRFEILHSSNGKDWSQIGKVRAAGESKTLQRYTYTHAEPVAGDNFYKMKMVDSDGSFAFSRIVAVYMDGADALTVFPNPAISTVSVKSLVPIVSYQLVNSDGKVIREEFQVNTLQLELADLTVSAGLYVLKMTLHNGQVAHRKLMIR